MKLIILLISLCFFACNGSPVSIKQNKKDSTDKIATFGSDDENMNAAIVKARQTFPVFLEQLKKSCDDCKKFSVKVKYTYGQDNGEHIWLNNLFFKGQRLFGIIDNQPENNIGLNLGDTIEVKESSLSDWMYIQKDKLIGGYTIKVVYEGLSDNEKSKMEKELGVKIAE